MFFSEIIELQKMGAVEVFKLKFLMHRLHRDSSIVQCSAWVRVATFSSWSQDSHFYRTQVGSLLTLVTTVWRQENFDWNQDFFPRLNVPKPKLGLFFRDELVEPILHLFFEIKPIPKLFSKTKFSKNESENLKRNNNSRDWDRFQVMPHSIEFFFFYFWATTAFYK